MRIIEGLANQNYDHNSLWAMMKLWKVKRDEVWSDIIIIAKGSF